MSVHELSGSTAVVTGASRGFGRAIAQELLHAGAHVVGVARSEPGLSQLRQEHGERFEFEVADAADPSLPERLFARHQPQIVVLNAGAAPVVGPLPEQTWETFSTNWHMDVRQAFNFAKASLQAPLEPGSVVVFVSSGAAVRGSPLSGGYAGAKATVRFVAAYAAAESARAGLGIRFVAVLPQLTPATELGAAGVAGYAARQGTDVPSFLKAFGPTLSTDQVGQAVVQIIQGPDAAEAYMLTAAGLNPVAPN